MQTLQPYELAARWQCSPEALALLEAHDLFAPDDSGNYPLAIVEALESRGAHEALIRAVAGDEEPLAQFAADGMIYGTPDGSVEFLGPQSLKGESDGTVEWLEGDADDE